jgi:sporulation protein YlmC with PRC-barrel domain
MLHSGSQLLRRGVTVRGVRVGDVEDVLLDPVVRRVLGLAVLCRDGVRRVLPLAAVDHGTGNGHLCAASALVLMDDHYYRERARTLTGLVDAAVRRDGVTVGTLVDVSFDEAGRVRLLRVEGLGEVPAGGGLEIDVDRT